MDPILLSCRELTARCTPTLGDLIALLHDINLSEDELSLLKMSDPSRPYGRRVLLGSAALEVMVATWTPGVPCAPHDHGGQVGGVKILSGTAAHSLWRLHEGVLQVQRTHHAEAGEVLACGPDLIHAMQAVGDEPLMTLHLYTHQIPFMVVYDLDRQQTLKVDGGCGAWIPEESAGLILDRRDGFHARSALA